MVITTTELKMNLGKYLEQAATEDIYISKKGKIIAKISAPYKNKLDIVNELYGSIPDSVTLDEAKEERRKFHAG
jgi:antitoxin (DNA-binding transcriptional repressor) of toxin-antitoxin stability system